MKTLNFFQFTCIFALIIQGQTLKCQNRNISDTLNIGSPTIDIRIDKEYDENGKIILYDSTYSYFYSNYLNDSLTIDSIFQEFQPYFRWHYPEIIDDHFNHLFFSDTLYHYDFF